MKWYERQYIDTLVNVMTNGVRKNNGIDTSKIVSCIKIDSDLQFEFPILTVCEIDWHKELENAIKWVKKHGDKLLGELSNCNTADRATVYDKNLYRFNILGEKLNCMVCLDRVLLVKEVPNDVVRVAFICVILANILGIKAGTLDYIANLGEIRDKEFDIAEEEFDRCFKNKCHRAPRVRFNTKIKDINNLSSEDLELVDYKHCNII
jgi:hypothetical protein